MSSSHLIDLSVEEMNNYERKLEEVDANAEERKEKQVNAM